MRTELRLKPGKSKRIRIKVTNYGETPIRVKPSLSDLRIRLDGTPEFIDLGSTTWSLKDAVVQTVQPFVLPPRTTRTVGLKVTLPENAKGGRYGAMLFESEALSPPGKKARTSTVTINIRLASLILIDVKGTEMYKAEVPAFKAFHEGGKIKVQLSVRNGGNLLIRPSGPIRLINGSTQVLTGELHPKRAVLPGDTAQYNIEWPDTNIAKGTYQIVTEVDYGGKEILGAKAELVID